MAFRARTTEQMCLALGIPSLAFGTPSLADGALSLDDGARSLVDEAQCENDGARSVGSRRAGLGPPVDAPVWHAWAGLSPPYVPPIVFLVPSVMNVTNDVDKRIYMAVSPKWQRCGH